MSDKSQFHRRSPRLDAFDYAEERAYFVTVCACERGEMFGRVVGDTVQLNAAGEIAQNCWLAIPAHFPFVELDLYVIMPDHIHGIIVIQPNDDGARHALPLQNQSRPVAEFGKPQPRTLGTIVGSYKSAVTKRVNDLRGTPAAPVWQRNYYDHIFRDESDLNAIRAYIETNPARWGEDREDSLNRPVWNRLP